jgi:hypothetical protein
MAKQRLKRAKHFQKHVRLLNEALERPKAFAIDSFLLWKKALMSTEDGPARRILVRGWHDKKGFQLVGI